MEERTERKVQPDWVISLITGGLPVKQGTEGIEAVDDWEKEVVRLR
jgi:hypothetical protein